MPSQLATSTGGASFVVDRGSASISSCAVLLEPAAVTVADSCSTARHFLTGVAEDSVCGDHPRRIGGPRSSPHAAMQCRVDVSSASTRPDHRGDCADDGQGSVYDTCDRHRRRNGHTRSADGIVDVDLSIPKPWEAPGRRGHHSRGPVRGRICRVLLQRRRIRGPSAGAATLVARDPLQRGHRPARGGGGGLRPRGQPRGDGGRTGGGGRRAPDHDGPPGLPVFECHARQSRRRAQGDPRPAGRPGSSARRRARSPISRRARAVADGRPGSPARNRRPCGARARARSCPRPARRPPGN